MSESLEVKNANIFPDRSPNTIRRFKSNFAAKLRRAYLRARAKSAWIMAKVVDADQSGAEFTWPPGICATRTEEYVANDHIYARRTKKSPISANEKLTSGVQGIPMYLGARSSYVAKPVLFVTLKSHRAIYKMPHIPSTRGSNIWRTSHLSLRKTLGSPNI